MQRSMIDKETSAEYTSDSDNRETGRSKESDIERGDRTAASGVSDVPPAQPALGKSAGTEPGPIPDGGLEAWLQVAGSWCILLASWGLVNSFGVYQTYYETQLLTSRSSSDISWVGSIQAALLLLVGVVSGPIYDAGYFKHLIVSGLFLLVFGEFMTSLCSQYWEVILAQGITVGIGMGLVFLPSTALLAQYFSKHRALAIGIASTGSPVGGIIFPIIFSRLEPTVGFGWATRVIAFILLAASIVPIVVMHPRLPPTGRIRSLVDTSAFRDAPYMVFAAGAFFSFLTLYLAFFYLQLFAEQHAIATKDFAPYLVTFLNVGSVFGRLVPNAMADAYGALNLMLVCTLVSGVLAFVWLGIHSLGGLIVFAVLYGLFSGGVVSLAPSVTVGLSPDLAHVGARMGIIFLVAGIAILVGTPIGGAVLGDATEQRWQGTIGYGGAGLLLGALGYAAARFLVWTKKGGFRA